MIIIFISIMNVLEKEIRSSKQLINKVSKELETKKFKYSAVCRNHKICKKISHMQVAHSVGIFLTTNHNNNKVLVLGKQKTGKYKNKYSFCAGTGEEKDTNSTGKKCWIKCLLRELFEEFKITINSVEEFGRIFLNFKMFVFNRTPIFMAHIDNLDKCFINNKIKQYNNAKDIDVCYKEMDHIEYFNLEDYKQVDGMNCILSSFVKGYQKKLKI